MMTSDRADRANRRNSQASTGPHTAAGRARSAQNARKHGLSAVDLHPDAEAEIERLAELVAGEHVHDAALLEATRAVAEAQFQLGRVRACKTGLLRNGASISEWRTEPEGYLPVEAAEELLEHLERLDRYERRALSRRKFAVRRFKELASKR